MTVKANIEAHTMNKSIYPEKIFQSDFILITTTQVVLEILSVSNSDLPISLRPITPTQIVIVLFSPSRT